MTAGQIHAVTFPRAQAATSHPVHLALALLLGCVATFVLLALVGTWP